MCTKDTKQWGSELVLEKGQSLNRFQIQGDGGVGDSNSNILSISLSISFMNHKIRESGPLATSILYNFFQLNDPSSAFFDQEKKCIHIMYSVCLKIIPKIFDKNSVNFAPLNSTFVGM